MIVPGVSNILEVLAQDGFTSWTPVYTASSGSFTTITTHRAVYQVQGRSTYFNIDFTQTNVGTASGTLIISLPTTPNQAQVYLGQTSGRAEIQAVSYGTALLYLISPTNTSVISVDSRINLQGRYRTA